MINNRTKGCGLIAFVNHMITYACTDKHMEDMEENNHEWA